MVQYLLNHVFLLISIKRIYDLYFELFLRMNLKTLGDFKKNCTLVIIKKSRMIKAKTQVLTLEVKAVEWQSSIQMLLVSWKKLKRTQSTDQII